MSAHGDDHALSDVTNKFGNVQVNEAAMERVKEANWGAREGYDYAKYTAEPRDKTAPGSESGPVAESSNWFANAAKYEWVEDFGDIGPAHEELEKILFGDEQKVEQGDKFSE